MARFRVFAKKVYDVELIVEAESEEAVKAGNYDEIDEIDANESYTDIDENEIWIISNDTE